MIPLYFRYLFLLHLEYQCFLSRLQFAFNIPIRVNNISDRIDHIVPCILEIYSYITLRNRCRVSCDNRKYRLIIIKCYRFCVLLTLCFRQPCGDCACCQNLIVQFCAAAECRLKEVYRQFRIRTFRCDRTAGTVSDLSRKESIWIFIKI